MSFTKNLLTLSLMASFAINSPLLLANTDFEETPYGEAKDYGNDIEESLEDFYGDEEFISIATGTKKAIHKAPAIATVITADEIKAMGANSIYDVFETVTGVHISPSNLDRAKPNFSIRGIHTAENPQTLLLVNGERTTYEYNGARWQQFNLGLNLIERIEVIRGPGSAIYGADAFSGVINIITKGVNSVSSTDFGAKAGSFNTQSSWFNHVNTDEKLKYSFNAQWYKTKGDHNRIVQEDAMHSLGLGTISNAPGALDTRIETIDLHAQISYEGLYATAWYLKNDGGTGAGAAQALSNSDYEKTKALTLTSGYKWDINSDLNLDFTVNYQTYDNNTYFVIYPEGMALPREFDEQGAPTAFTVFTDGIIGQPIAHEKHYGANLVANYSALAQHNIRMSVGYRYSEAKNEEFKNFGLGVLDGSEDFVDGTLTDVTGTPYIYILNQDRELYFLTLQDEWQLADDWELTAGIRYDNYSDFGSTINPRLALVWQTQHNLTTKLLYGEAFRAPSFQELYAINNPIVLGNKNLEPEKIKTTELAVDYRLNFDWQLTANLFYYQAKDLINWIAQGDGTNVAQNSDNQNGYGAELEAHWKPSESLKIKAGYAWQNSENQTTKQDIADAPGQTFNVSINWDINEELKLYIDTHWIMSRERLSSDIRDNIDDYNRTNISANYKVSNNLSMKFTVRNAFDSNALEPSNGQIAGDYPLETRGYWLSVRYNL